MPIEELADVLRLAQPQVSTNSSGTGDSTVWTTTSVTRHGSAPLEFPSDCEVLITRQFDASAELLFDVLTKPEHVRVETWVFEGRPDDEAVETTTLHEEDGVTTMTTLLAFRDQSSRDSMFQHALEHLDDPAVAIDGMQASFEKLEDLIRTLA